MAKLERRDFLKLSGALAIEEIIRNTPLFNQSVKALNKSQESFRVQKTLTGLESNNPETIISELRNMQLDSSTLVMAKEEKLTQNDPDKKEQNPQYTWNFSIYDRQKQSRLSFRKLSFKDNEEARSFASLIGGTDFSDQMSGLINLTGPIMAVSGAVAKNSKATLAGITATALIHADTPEEQYQKLSNENQNLLRGALAYSIARSSTQPAFLSMGVSRFPNINFSLLGCDPIPLPPSPAVEPIPAGGMPPIIIQPANPDVGVPDLIPTPTPTPMVEIAIPENIVFKVEEIPSSFVEGEFNGWQPHPDPWVQKPNKSDELPEDFDPENADFEYISYFNRNELGTPEKPGDPHSPVIFAVDKKSNTVLTARYENGVWKWRNPDIYVKDYADALSVENGNSITGSWFTVFTPGYSITEQRIYEQRMKEFCNLITIPLFAWKAIEPTKGQFDKGTFDFIDTLVDKFHSLGIKKIRGQALIQPAMFPKWLLDDVRNAKINKDELWDIVKEHVSMLVKWGKGESIATLGIPRKGSRRINQWTAVTEPFRHYGYNNNEDILQSNLGETYVDDICKLVRELDPEAEIIVEDTNNHVTKGWNSINNVSQADTTTKSQELALRLWGLNRIDRWGVEGFLDGANPPDYQNMTETLSSYNVPVDITSFNVDMRYVGGTQENRWNQQGIMYETSRNAMFASNNVVGFSVWENGDKWNYTDPKRGGNPNADPTTLDDDLNWKPSHLGLVNSYRRQLGFQTIPTT